MSEEANKNKEKPKVKENDNVTIQDFKSILVGMDLILGDQWTPDENQWKRIRRKIDALIETHERSVDSNRNVSETESLRFPEWPSVPANANVPVGEVPIQSALVPSALVPPAVAQPNTAVADGSGAQIKTPDIDSRSGYKSGYV